MSQNAPPKHLDRASKAWWRQIVATYELEPHHFQLLQLAAEAFDECQEARKTLTKDGRVYLDRFDQPRAHPCVAIERDARLAHARLLRELSLTDEPSASHAHGLPGRCEGRR